MRQTRNVRRVARLLSEESPCPRFTSRAVAGIAKTTRLQAHAHPDHRHLHPTIQSLIASPVLTPVRHQTALQVRQTHHQTLLTPSLTPTAAPLIATRRMPNRLVD
jgi:hypothetical protein